MVEIRKPVSPKKPGFFEAICPMTPCCDRPRISFAFRVREFYAMHLYFPHLSCLESRCLPRAPTA